MLRFLGHALLLCRPFWFSSLCARSALARSLTYFPPSFDSFLEFQVIEKLTLASRFPSLLPLHGDNAGRCP